MPDSGQLEAQLQDAYALRFVRLVPFTQDYGVLKRSLGECAALLFGELIGESLQISVGIGGGATIRAMIESLPREPRTIRIYPMSLVGRGPEIKYVDSGYLVAALFHKSRPLARAFVVGIPPLPSEKTEAKAFNKYLLSAIPEVRLVHEGAKRVGVAFVGLGAMLPMEDFSSEMAKLGVSIRDLLADGALGGINYNWFDVSGNQIGQYFITVSVAELKQMAADPAKLIVLVAGGKHKQESLGIALSSRMANCLVTDSQTASSLLTQMQSSHHIQSSADSSIGARSDH